MTRKRARAPGTGTDKREAILSAALELFAERGFHGTAVPEVAKRARVAAGTVYLYFESKEALVNALFQQWKSALFAELMRDFPVGGAIRKQFHEIWQRLGRFATQHPEAFAFLELHHHGYLDATSRRMEEDGLRQFQAIIEGAQASKVMKAGSSELLMALAYGAFVGLLKGQAHGYLKLTPSVLDSAEDIVWQALRR